MTSPLILRVVGDPNAPKGSGRAMLIAGKARHVASGSDVNKQKIQGWMAAVADACPTTDLPSLIIGTGVGVACGIVFRFPMRQADLDPNGGPLQRAPFGHVVKPDADKLVRSTLDALTAAGAWTDDAQVMPLAFKAYVPPGETTGAWIALAPFAVTGSMDVSGLHEVTRLWSLEIAARRVDIQRAITEAQRDRDARRRSRTRKLEALP